MKKFLSKLGRRLACMAVAAGCTGALAADYPTRPVRLVVGYAAGGGGDQVARALVPGLSARLGQQVIVDNRPGAAGSVGADAVAKASPDGYTLLVGDRGMMVYNAGMFRKLSYDPGRDFAPIGKVVDSYYVLVATRSLGVNDFAALRKEALARPGQLNYAATATGSTAAMEFLKQRTGMDIVRVPYRGAAPALQAVISGETQLMLIDALTAVAQIKGGTVKAIAVTAPRRLTLLPDVPTLDEAGVRDFSAGTWVGLFAPAGTPGAIVAQVSAALRQTVASPEVTKFIADGGLEPGYAPADEMGRMLESELGAWPARLRGWGMSAD